MNIFIKTNRLTNKTTRTWHDYKGVTTINNIISRFIDIIHSATICQDSRFTKTFTRTFYYGSRQVIGFLITLLCKYVVKHTGETEQTVIDDGLGLIQDFTFGTKTSSVEVGNM